MGAGKTNEEMTANIILVKTKATEVMKVEIIRIADNILSELEQHQSELKF